MNPEEVKELLARIYGGDGQDTIAGSIPPDWDELGESLGGPEGYLVALLPDLAEIVAGLRYKYGVAVEMPHGTRYLAEDIDGDIWPHSDPHFPAVMWFEWDRDAEDAAYFWNKDHPEHATARVVRRLVGEPEVAE